MDKKIFEAIRKFNHDRDWEQFHTSENLAKSLVIEAGELLEEFQWDSKEKSLEGIKDELADVLLYAYMLADKYHLDVEEIMLEKIKKNDKKYPIEKSKGKSKKYNEY
ncbi:MAG: nucleotide pyrophosphohydrolase [Acholeplasmataceae bacterium]|nr:nucleotide pyrophosphohydrolase [Acholeplasmataceae bacterium]